MHAPLRKIATYTLLTAGLCSAYGCKRAAAPAEVVVPGGHDDTTIAALKKSASDTTLPTELQIHARMVLAQAQTDAANDLIADIDRDEISIGRLTGEIAQLGRMVEANNTAIAGYRERAPGATKKVGEALTQARDAINGSGNAAWFKGEKSEIPALAALKKNSEELSKAVADLKSQRQALEQQRAKTIEQAEAFEKAAQRSKGQESVEQFRKGAQARKQADDLATQMTAIDAKIVPLEQDLRVAATQSTELEASATGFDKRIEENTADAETIDKQITAHGALSKKLVGSEGDAPAPPAGDETPGPAETTNTSMSAKAQLLAALVNKVAANRAKALDYLNGALEQYVSAEKLAGTLSRETQTLITSNPKTPQIAAWRTRQEINSADQFKLAQANVKQMIAGLRTSGAASAAARGVMIDALGPVLKEAGLEVPNSLSAIRTGKEGDSPDAGYAAAEKAYGEADELVKDVAQSPSASTNAKKAAYVAGLTSTYAQAELHAVMAGKPEAAASELNEGKAAISAGSPVPQDDLDPALLDAFGMRPAIAPAPLPQPETAPAAPAPPPEVVPTPAPAPATPPPAAKLPVPGAKPPVPPKPIPAKPAAPPAKPAGAKPAPAAPNP